PLYICALKWLFLIEVFTNSAFYFCPLSHNARLILFDYNYLSNIGSEFSLVTAFLFLCPLLMIDQLFVYAIKTDYIQLTNQILLRRRGKRYFLRSTFRINKNNTVKIEPFLRKQMVTFANCFCG